MISASERPSREPVLDRLPGRLRETLERSFVDRERGVLRAEHNLDNAWYAGDHPRTVEEAVTAIGPQGIDVLTRIHQRIERLDPSGDTWREIRYVRNLWWGGSAGFKAVYRDPESLRVRLHGLFDRVAPDLLVGALEHQLRPAIRILMRTPPWRLVDPRAAPPDCDTWREISGLGKEALHFCVGRHEDRPVELDDIHLDWRSPVVRADPVTRRCAYALGESVRHWLQAKRGVGLDGGRD